mmetsp:Transcript_47830/g.110030  ORF Transcript_47830/g.110030 Transcript_47830/m.110030 type:complete len:235 (-) Transcript_47830:83-787(-)
MMHYLGLTNKRSQNLAREGNPTLQFLFVVEIQRRYLLDQCCWIDEVSADSRLSRRVYGWSLSGVPCRRGGIWHGGKHYSALGLFWIGGMIDCWVVEGSLDADLFHLAVCCTVLPHMQAYPRQRSVIFADNCITHHFQNWITDLQYKGSLVHFLEPLTPTHNPIEDGFKCGRSWARANCDRLHTFQSPEHFIRESLMSVGYQQARHCVHNCSTFGGIPAYESMLARFDAGERAPM